jgi:hypothetical protein
LNSSAIGSEIHHYPQILTVSDGPG